MFRKLRKLAFMSVLGSMFIFNGSFAQNQSSPCDLVKTTYKICNEKSKELFKNPSPDMKRKSCSFTSMSITIDMYNTLSQKLGDKEFAKNLSILLGLICKDGCMGSDDFYSDTKDKLCK